ncbi:MAG: hypothetical protein EA349_12770 [Halomonadaceae bacterium]|nr:MAG: hypothetical protein EA349_12770 [Halomonadaceae bacterium]
MIAAPPALGQAAENIRISGYLQASPLLISTEQPEPIGQQNWTEYRLQSRLNVSWFATPELTFNWQMRTRVFAGDLVREFPEYVESIDTDDGLVDLSWMVTEHNDWLLHHIPDRLYAQWNRGDWDVRIGRQRVNWGVNMITNPNDIFNIYSFYDFDYPERPGSDAIRIQRHLGFASRFEVVVSPARDSRDSVAAALYGFHMNGYDVQLISGYYRDRFTVGAGWAGDFRGVGVKGETMFYNDINSQDDTRETNFIVATSLEYMFENSLFGIVEILYNREGGRDEFTLVGEQLTPDNPSFSTYQATTQLRYPIHPLLDGSVAVVWYPDERATFISPQLTWSVTQDVDFKVLGQFFAGRDDSVFGNAGNLLAASLTYNF